MTNIIDNSACHDTELDKGPVEIPKAWYPLDAIGDSIYARLQDPSHFGFAITQIAVIRSGADLKLFRDECGMPLNGVLQGALFGGDVEFPGGSVSMADYGSFLELIIEVPIRKSSWMVFLESAAFEENVELGITVWMLRHQAA